MKSNAGSLNKSISFIGKSPAEQITEEKREDTNYTVME